MKVYKEVPVASIVEYPTSFGRGGCHLLRETEGTDQYSITEEEISEFLETSAKNPQNLLICQNGYCRFFVEQFLAGRTPKVKEPIQLSEYQGKFWTTEGKHRVCAAKRTGATFVDAWVEQLQEDNSILPPIGEHGAFCASITTTSHRRNGSNIFIDASFRRFNVSDNHYRGFATRLFRQAFNASEGKASVFPGCSITIIWRRSNRVLTMLQQKEIIDITVEVTNDLPNGKLWIARVPFDHNGRPDFSQKEDLFRRGNIRRFNAPAIWEFGTMW